MRLSYSRGYLRVGSFRGAPVRIHLTTPLGLFVIGGFSFSPAAWVGYLILVLAHEVGHALLVRRERGRVLCIDILPFGGECAYDHVASPLSHSVIAWGGVIAQGIIFGGVSVLSRFGLIPHHSVWRELAGVLLAGNFILIVINLLPISTLDGATAWKLFPLLWRRERLRRKSQPAPRKSSGSSQRSKH